MSRIAIAFSCIALFTASVPASPAHAQDINPFEIVRAFTGVVGTLSREQRKAEARQAARLAAEREEARRAELMKTKKGRQQLAREEAARKAEQERNTRIAAGFIGAILSGGGSGGSAQDDRRDYEIDRQSGPASSYSPPAASAPPISSFYSSCHGGSFYGC